MGKEIWTVLLAVALLSTAGVGSDSVAVEAQEGDTQAAVDSKTKRLDKSLLLKMEDFGEVLEEVIGFRESDQTQFSRLGRAKSKPVALEQIAEFKDGRSCSVCYYLWDSEEEASDAIHEILKSFPSASRQRQDAGGFGLEGAEDLYVTDRTSGSESLLFRHGRLAVYVAVYNDVQGDAATLRDSLARGIVKRARGTYHSPGDSPFKAFLLREEDFSSRRLQTLKESLWNSAFPLGPSRKIPEYKQEIFLEDGCRCFVNYRLVRTENEASKLIKAHVSDVAAPSRRVEKPPTLGLDGADDVYVFEPGGSKTNLVNAALVFRYSRLYVMVSVHNDTTGDAANLRDALAKAILQRAKVVFASRDDRSDSGKSRNYYEQQDSASVTLANVVYVDMFSSDYTTSHPLVCEVGRDFPAGRELAFRRPESGESVHAVFPENVAAPEDLKGSFVLRGHYQRIQNRDSYKLKKPSEDYRYFVVSSWEHSEAR